MDYTNGTKATWRFWVWKRLRERLRGVHPSHRLNAAKAVRTMNGAVRLRAIDN